MSQQFLNLLDQERVATLGAIDQLQDCWPSAIDLTIDRSLSVFDSYPQLFLEAFPTLTSDDVHPLAVAARLFATGVMMTDSLLDKPEPQALVANGILRLQAMHVEGYGLLHQLFAPSALFWQRWRELMAEYLQACQTETEFAFGDRPWQEYTEALAHELACGKSAISRSAIAGLVELSGDDQWYEPLVTSIKQYSIARQMFDDLCDWKQDIQYGFPSLLLVRVIHERPARDQLGIERLVEQAGRAIYYQGHAQAILQQALAALDQAEDVLRGLPPLAWLGLIADLRQRCQALLDDVDRIVRANLERLQSQPSVTLALPHSAEPRQQLAWDALRFLVRQWQLGFGEARQIKRLSHAAGFNAPQEYCYGDVFQRALIADGLCDAQALLGDQLRPLIEREVQHLLGCRHTDGVGGWSYFPAVPEIAPDADDLAQVMQVLLRAGERAEVEQTCELPLSVLLRDNARADGSFETWIVPRHDRTPQQERQALFSQTRWRAGPDPEVMANLLYALALYDPVRFDAVLERGVTYLEGCQNADGSWSSTWYYGLYYGTYVCLRLFARVRPAACAVVNARQFLCDQQRADGGWGAEQSDPLNTALALLGLAVVAGEHSGTLRERADRGLDYLRSAQTADGAWPAIRFILPKASDPYSSKTLTTLYVLRAALAWYQLGHASATEGC